MRLFCDENIRDTTTEWLRALGHDAVSVKEVGYAGMDDSVVFNYAVAENRMLLTFNADFSDIRALAAVDHPGIIRLRFKIQTEEVVHPRSSERSKNSSTRTRPTCWSLWIGTSSAGADHDTEVLSFGQPSTVESYSWVTSPQTRVSACPAPAGRVHQYRKPACSLQHRADAFAGLSAVGAQPPYLAWFAHAEVGARAVGVGCCGRNRRLSLRLVVGEGGGRSVSLSRDLRENVRGRTRRFPLSTSGSGRRPGSILDLQDLRNGHSWIPPDLLPMGRQQQRVVPMGRTAIKYLENYLNGIRPHLEANPEEKALFLDQFGQRYPYHTLRRRLHAYAGKAGIDIQVTPHTFRCSCTTELLRGGANMYHVKEMLGHESLDTLKHDARLTITDLKKTHRKCHPRKKDLSQSD